MAIIQESLANEQFGALGMDEMTRDMTAVIAAVNEANLDEVNYTEVAVSSAEILSCYSSPKEILPAAGASSYYEIDRVILEYTHVTTAYTYSITDVFGLWYYDGGSTYTYTYVTTPNFIRTTGNKVCQFSGERVETYAADSGTPVAYPPYYGVNESLVLSSYTADPTLGDGTILVKVWYKLRTFGSEL